MSRVATKKKKGSKKAFLSEAYFRFFNGREYTEATTYLVITQKERKEESILTITPSGEISS